MSCHPIHQGWRQENTVWQWREAFANNGHFFQPDRVIPADTWHGEWTPTRRPRARVCEVQWWPPGRRQTWLDPIPGRGAPTGGSETQTKCTVCNVISPHVSPTSTLQVNGDMLAHRGRDVAQRRKWLMSVSYPRHQGQFGSSGKILEKCCSSGGPNFFSRIIHRGRSYLIKGDFIISLLVP